MADLSHDAVDEGFHEIQLSGKQLVFLFIVTTLVSVAIFLCGVLVGRGARAARGEEPVQAAAQNAPAPAPTPVAESAPPAAAEPPPAPAETPDELSYHKRLQAASAPPEELKPVSREPARRPAETRPTPPAPAAASMPADVPTAGRPGTWVVQVQALRDRDVGVAITKRLIGRGYPAFLVAPTADAAPQLYKVHVGRYADRTEAEEVKRRLEKEEQFRPWIIR